MLQHLSKGRVDLMLGRGNTAPVYPWFGQDIRQSLPLARQAAAPNDENDENKDIRP